MKNRYSKIKIFFHAASFIFFCLGALFLDTFTFSWGGKPVTQFLFCGYLILLMKNRSLLRLFLLILLLALESVLFWGQAEYLLFFALLAYITINIFKELIHIPIVIPFITLNLVLSVQTLFAIIYLQHPYADFFYTIGHFSVNNVFLIMYWIFENKGKQGNRS